MATAIDDRKQTFDEYFDTYGCAPTYFIIGCQGSGTNHLARTMRAALRFSVVTDRSLIFNSAVAVLKNPTLQCAITQSKQIQQSFFPSPLRKRLLRKNYYRQSQNYVGIEKHITAAHTTSAPDFANFFYTFHAYVNGSQHKAVKSDDIWENLEHIRLVAPDFRVILLMRDPRDIALSIRNKFHFGPREIFEAAKYVKQRLDIYSCFLNESPERLITVRYEDLLADPRPSMNRLAEFAGAEKDTDDIRKSDELKIKRANFDKWKQLSLSDIAATEYVLRDNIERFGYRCATPVGPGPGWFSRTGRYLKDKALRVPQKLVRKTRRMVHG